MLIPLAFAAIAVATVGFARTSRQNRTQLIIVAVVWAIGLRLLGFAMFNLTRAEIWPVFMLYAMPLGALALALAIAMGRTETLERAALAAYRTVPWARLAAATGLDRAYAALVPRLSTFLQRAGFRG